MSYVKTIWVSTVTAVDAAPMNNLEDQVDDIRRALKPPIVRWTIPGLQSVGSNVITAVTANRIYYTLIYVPDDTTYDRIGIYVQTGDGAGGVADLRIFEEAAGIPGDLVLSAGTVSTNASGAKEIAIAEALVRGYYFLAVRCDNTPSLTARTGIGPASDLATSNTQGIPSGVNVLYDDAAYADPAGAVDGVEQNSRCFVRLREA